MWISPAYAQSAPSAGESITGMLLPMILIFAVFWFLLIRPQQKKVKEHRAMVESLKRGDQVVTSGGIMGKVTKVVDDTTVQVEIAENVRVKVVKATVSDVLSRTEPVREGGSKGNGEKSDGGGKDEAPRKSIFSFGKK